MSGRATLTTVMSSNNMKIAVQTAINVHPALECGHQGPPGHRELARTTQCKGHNGRPGRAQAAGAAVEADHLAGSLPSEGRPR